MQTQTNIINLPQVGALLKFNPLIVKSFKGFFYSSLLFDDADGEWVSLSRTVNIITFYYKAF